MGGVEENNLLSKEHKKFMLSTRGFYSPYSRTRNG